MNKRNFLFLIPGILFCFGRLAAEPATFSAGTAALPAFLKEAQAGGGMVRNEVVGGRAPGRNYSGFGDRLKVSSLEKGDCVVIRIGTMGFSRGFVCGKESQDPEEKMERSQMIVPYAFYAKKYLARVMRVRARGRNYAGFGFENKEDWNLLQLQNGPFGLLGKKISRNSDSKNTVKEKAGAGEIPGIAFEESLHADQGEETPPLVVPIAPESLSSLQGSSEIFSSVLLLEKNISSWAANPVSLLGSAWASQTEVREEDASIAFLQASPDPSDFSNPGFLDIRSIERHFFDGGGARGHDGISQPTHGLPALSNKENN